MTWLVTGTLAATLAGCGEPDPLKGKALYPVKGKVLLAEGKPLTSGNVVFVATKSTITSTAAIGPDGAFAFKNASGDGLPEGEYRARIEVTDTTASRDKGKAALPFASHYLDEDISDLTATVTSDESKNDFQFKLEAKDPTKSAASPPARGGR